MNKYISLFITLSQFFASQIVAQHKISGTVIADDLTPLAYANVILTDSNKVFITGEPTNDNGYFELECPQGTFIISISYIGDSIFTKQVHITQSLDLGQLFLKQNESLQELTIKSKRLLIKQDFDKLIFDVEHSPLSTGYDGLEVLKRSPKLQMNAQGNLLIRNNPVMVMINGRPLNLSGQELNTYLASLNAENIKSIEIQTSGNAETDAQNNGGVVNIILKKVPDGFQSTVRSYYEYRNKEHGRFFAGLNTQYSNNKWFLYHRIGYNRDRNMSNYNSTLTYFTFEGKNANNGSSQSQNNTLNNTLGIVFYPNNKHEIGIEFYSSIKKTNRTGVEYLDIYNPSLSARSKNDNTDNDTTNFWNTTLNYTFKTDSLGSSLKLIADLGNNLLDNNNEVATQYELGTNIDNANRFVSYSNSTLYNFQIDRNKIISEKWKYLIGTKLLHVNRQNTLNQYLLNINEWQSVSSGNQDFDNKEWIWASYMSVSHSFKEKHNIKIGLRAENTSLLGHDNINNTQVENVSSIYSLVYIILIIWGIIGLFLSTTTEPFNDPVLAT